MQKHQTTVDGKILGRFTKSDKLKKLGILKGIQVKTVEETDREKALRLQAGRERRKYRQTATDKAKAEQPSLIEGVPTIEVYHGGHSAI